MNKETIRPLLVEELEKLRAIELEAHKGPVPEGWEGLAALLEARQAARLKRAQAELQLWLADREWEREVIQECTEAVQDLDPEGRLQIFRTVSPIIKP